MNDPAPCPSLSGSAHPARDISPQRLTAVLFLLSFATVLFTVVLFRLLTFFIMPSLFFDLLFIGFPLGALAGAYFFRIGRHPLLRSLWLLQGAMLVSIGAMFACKHFDYLRAHLFDVQLHSLFLQMLTFTLFFLPFFVAYGLSEYIGYQVGRRHLRGRMPVVYGIFLFGAAAAYLFALYGFPLFGAARLLVFTFLLVAAAMLLLLPRARLWPLLALEQAALLALLLLPGLEGGFLRLYKGTSPQSTHAYAELGFQTIFQQWGRYSLVEIVQAADQEYYVGFYNDIVQWRFTPRLGFFRPGMGMIPIDRAPRQARIAIIGAGGGRQVQYARRTRPDLQEIQAIEIEPLVLQAVQGELAGRFDHVYQDPKVTVVNREARGYLEESAVRFDLIYLPSVGGYPQMMLEPGNMIRTLDAFRNLAGRLTPRGVLAIWYPAVLDPKGILTEQYLRTLEGPQVGLQVRAFRSPGDVLLLGSGPAGSLPTLEEVQESFLSSAPGPLASPMLFFAMPVQVEKTWDAATFQPISDNQPFLAGNVQHIFSLEQVGRLFALAGGLLAALAGLLLWLLRRRGDPRIPGRSFPQVLLIGLLIGANFLVMEHYLILALFRKLYVYYDALVLGAISFLVLSGLGSSVITPAQRHRFQMLGALLILVLLLSHQQLPPWASLALLAPVAFVTGSFFPALFEAAADNPLGVFAADAVGAALGAMAAFFVPIVFGFDVFFAFATVTFWVTAFLVYRFFRGLEGSGQRRKQGRARATL
jgi:hypothetical protein